MSKYEMAVRISQVQNLVEERKYRKAAAVLSTIDVRQVKSQSELQTFAEVYVKTEQFEAAKAIYLRIYKRNRNKKVLYRLIYLAIRTNHLDEAEEFYEEFQDLNHSEQESLILRYRIDKAKGVPFNRLIETLERLKEEDYVEEWAYELAKLYQRAGREEECRRECEDIKLWFGDGEIVERAQALLDYLDEDETIYYEDRDYTVDPPEEPNPEDTGSLPDLGPELMKQEIEKMKKKKREEKRREYIEDADDEDEEFVDDYDDETEDGELLVAPEEITQKAKGGFHLLRGLWKRGGKDRTEEETTEEENLQETYPEDEEAADMVPQTTEPAQNSNEEMDEAAAAVEPVSAGEDEDDLDQWRPETSEQTETAQSTVAPMSQEMKNTLAAAVENVLAEQAAAQEETEKPEKPSQSGLGITQDLAKEITAIFEAEKREQLKEKAVSVVDDAAGRISDVPNLASDVLGRMTQAVQSKVGKTYIPMDVSEPAEETADAETASAEAVEEADTIAAEPEGVEEVQRPVGMEEIVSSGVLPVKEDDVTMIELDQIMPEPDIPELRQVIPEDSPELGNLPELEEDELPTTRALHHSFNDILTLIAGELEPKHFVLMGEGEDKIIGITKKIVRVNYEKGFLSTNQIAKISSSQLNQMDLLRVCNQIKGNCLLIDNASELAFSTITKIFAVMDAFRGDFIVVLADDGNTLDELFRVAPALARRFEYVIDIGQYSEEDYQ
ncbi:hypothetical protein [Jutongia sp.]|uniref:tetratricopeptide repeat protein n=1 Tax=Jutongia sp. TaxID=2944204 RepID=UPI00307A50C2